MQEDVANTVRRHRHLHSVLPLRQGGMHRKRWTIHHLHHFDSSRHILSSNFGESDFRLQFPDCLCFSCTSQRHICRDLYYSHSHSHSHLFVLYNAIRHIYASVQRHLITSFTKLYIFVGLAKATARYGCGDGVDNVIHPRVSASETRWKLRF